MTSTFAAPTGYDVRSGKAIAQTDLLDRLALADVVFIGEQHTDPATHRLEMELLTRVIQFS